MLLRILYLVALIGVVGGDTTASSSTDEDETRMGGEGFGNVVMLFVLLGGLVLAGVIVLGILALTGQFENNIVDPPV